MGGGYQLIDILLFAAIAGFLVFRLRSVLGRRTGLEQRRDPFQAPPPPQAQPAPPPRLRAINGDAAPAGPAAALKAADPSFSDDAFLTGARGAFELIVKAFAAGDKATLEPLLSQEVSQSFVGAIEARRAANETMETKLVALKSAEITDSAVEGSSGFVTVKFVSDQTNVTRAADGKVVEGDADRVDEHIDFWTFARSLRARDPNWMLVATKSP
ncbi:MAG TPA: Tim44/TimA family putative adaptor protein [Stellaceae bacterium]|nr:Tim44/TimA family putative adaptor protein [Stellaceae bacterium]